MRGESSAARIPVGAAAAFYLAMTGIGVVGIRWARTPVAVLDAIFRDAAIGLAVGIGIASISGLAAARSGWGREMERGFGEVLGAQPSWSIPLLAVLSGVGEEVLFRGALQAHLGVWFQALVFGAFHFPFRRELWSWPLFAGALGLLFGWMTVWTGTIWAAVLAHASINGINLWRIVNGRGRIDEKDEPEQA